MIDQMIERAKRLIESEQEQTLVEYELFSLLEQMQQELKNERIKRDDKCDYIIKSWERCQKCDMSLIALEEGKKTYQKCEYTTGLYCRQDNLITDTISLLKGQAEQ